MTGCSTDPMTNRLNDDLESTTLYFRKETILKEFAAKIKSSQNFFVNLLR
jgi:hypothetical protein